jgi:4-hydroxybenzoate polyprenyltransferase
VRRDVSVPVALLKTMRPKQWTKNLIVFLPLIFSGGLDDPGAGAASVAGFALLCLLSGSVYLLNDLRDAEQDRMHAKKSQRPIASGALDPRVAAVAGFVLAAGALTGGFLLEWHFGVVASGYFVLQVVYTLYLKTEVILDVMSISAGFVLRAVAGAAVIGVVSSPWLLMCAALLALFLALAKRRHELILLEEGAGAHREVLDDYSAGLIDAMLSTVTAATILAYSTYTFASETGEGSPYLMLTVPFVVYGMFRYLYLIHMKNMGGSPEEILLTDVPLILSIVGWLGSAGAIMYFA